MQQKNIINVLKYFEYSDSMISIVSKLFGLHGSRSKYSIFEMIVPFDDPSGKTDIVLLTSGFKTDGAINQ